MGVGTFLKEKFGHTPHVEYTKEEYLSQLSEGEQKFLSDLWDYLVSQRQALGGVDLSIALVGGITRSVNRPNVRRNKPTLNDVDIVITNSARPNSPEESHALLATDKLLQEYLKNNETLDVQLAGPDWYLGRESHRRIKKNFNYFNLDLLFVTKADIDHNIRPFDILVSGYGKPNMFERPNITNNGKNPYVVLFSTRAF